MKKYSVYAVVTGTKYMGDFEAVSEEQAIDLARVSAGADIRFCHQCSRECEDPMAHKFTAELNE